MKAPKAVGELRDSASKVIRYITWSQSVKRDQNSCLEVDLTSLIYLTHRETQESLVCQECWASQAPASKEKR